MRAYKANMIPGGVTPTINVSQYDNDYAVTVTLIEGAEIYTPPSGATIRVEGTKPDGHGFEYPCTYQGNVVTMPMYTQMTAVAGRFPIELVVYQSGLRVGSCNIIFAVERAPLGEDADISETVIPDIIAGAQAQADAAAASATQAASSAASAETAKDAAMDAAQDAIDAAQELQTAIQFNSALIHETASGAVSSFSDGADNIPMQSVVAEITPVQSGTGDPSPTNVRPISGRAGLTLTRSGKNLLNLSGNLRASSNGLTFTPDANDGNKVAISGTASSTWSSLLSLQIPIALKAGRTYTFSVGRTIPNSAFIRIVNADGTNTARVIPANSDHITWTQTADGTTVSEIVLQNLTSGSAVTYTLSFMVEDGASATAYEPYVGQTYPITWETEAGTVYGGTLDVVSGVLTVDREYIQFTADKWTLWNNTDKAAFTNAEYSGQTVTMCDSLVPNSTGIYVRIADGRVRAIAPWAASCTSLAEFKTALANNPPINAVLTLATPQTYQLTPTEVRTILGGNTIYTDAGDVSVEYIADTKLYIDNKIAELQALVLEN